jgi:hypothetical protein
VIETVELLRKGETLEGFTRSALSSFKFFEERVLGRDVCQYNLDFFSDFYGLRRAVISAFRGSGKTTTLGVDFPLFMACRDEFERVGRQSQTPMRFMTCSPTQKLSLRTIREFDIMVGKFEFLNWLKPRGKEKVTWTQKEKHCSNGVVIYNEIWNQNMRGTHFTHALLDEISLYEDKSIYYGVVEPMATLYDGHIMGIGTPISEYDLLHELSEKPHYHVRSLPSVVNGTPSCPTRFPIRKLEAERERVGYADYAREYLLQFTDEKERLYTPNDIARCLDRDLSFINVGQDPELGLESKGPRTYFIGGDLASSPTGDYTAMAVVEPVGNRVMLRHLNRFRGLDFQAHQDLITDYHRRFNPLFYEIDVNPFGKQLSEEIRRKDGIGIGTFEFTPHNRLNALVNLSRLMSSDRLRIPRAPDAATTAMTDALIHELSGMIPDRTKSGVLTYKSTTKHDDLVMALSIACLLASKTQLSGSTKGVTFQQAKVDMETRLRGGTRLGDQGTRKYANCVTWKKPGPNYLQL